MLGNEIWDPRSGHGSVFIDPNQFAALIKLRELDEYAEANISQNNRSHFWQPNPCGFLTVVEIFIFLKDFQVRPPPS